MRSHRTGRNASHSLQGLTRKPAEAKQPYVIFELVQTGSEFAPLTQSAFSDELSVWAVKGEWATGVLLFTGRAALQRHFSSIKRLALNTLSNHWLKKFHTLSPLSQQHFFVLFATNRAAPFHNSLSGLMGPTARGLLCSHRCTVAVVKDAGCIHSIPFHPFHCARMPTALSSFPSWSTLSHRHCCTCYPAGVSPSKAPQNCSSIVRNKVQPCEDVSAPGCTLFLYRLLLTETRAGIFKGGGREVILKDTVICSENT